MQSKACATCYSGTLCTLVVPGCFASRMPLSVSHLCYSHLPVFHWMSFPADALCVIIAFVAFAFTVVVFIANASNGSV